MSNKTDYMLQSTWFFFVTRWDTPAKILTSSNLPPVTMFPHGVRDLRGDISARHV